MTQEEREFLRENSPDLITWLSEEVEVARAGADSSHPHASVPKRITRLAAIHEALALKQQIDTFNAAIVNPYEKGGYKELVIQLTQMFGDVEEYFKGSGKNQEKCSRLNMKRAEVGLPAGVYPRISFTRRESLDRLKLMKAGVTAEQLARGVTVKHAQELRWVREGQDEEGGEK